MKYIDLYSGIGGFRLALDKQGHKCVFSAEIDASAIQTYEKNFNDKAAFDLDSLQNMTDEEINMEIPDHDLLVGGFPCQPFSIGGKRAGFDTFDTKGTQFFNILKILDVKKPNYIFLENVPYLFRHDNGNTWRIIKNELSIRGYQMTNKEVILSPVDFGIPQNRKRVFIIASKIKRMDNFKFEKSESFINIIQENEYNKDYKIKKEDNDILNKWGDLIKEIKFPEGKTLPVIWIDEMISEEFDDDWPNWKKKYVHDMRNLYMINKQLIDFWISKNDAISWTKRNKKFEWQAGKEFKEIKNTIITFRQSGIRCKSKPIFPTLVAMVQTPIIFDKELNYFRNISLREAANLQSFPPSFKINPIKNQAYKQFGNAVNVKVIEELVKFYFND